MFVKQDKQCLLNVSSLSQFYSAMGHFQVALKLIMKARLSAKLFTENSHGKFSLTYKEEN